MTDHDNALDDYLETLAEAAKRSSASRHFADRPEVEAHHLTPDAAAPLTESPSPVEKPARSAPGGDRGEDTAHGI
jgi:hypothetical protein